MKYVLFLLWLSVLTITAHGEILGPVDSEDALNRALAGVEAGDTILIADGRYANWSIELAVDGTASDPVVLRPDSDRGVVFTGSSHFAFTGVGIVLTGFIFDGCDFERNLLELRGADHCRIENCVIQSSGGQRAAIGIKAGSESNTIENCHFVNIAARCINLNIGEEIYARGIPAGNLIRGNRFEDIPFAGENGRETIKVGTNQPTYGHVRVETIVEDNLFVRCNGEGEIISNKCAGNTYRRNVFEQCQGELVMRGGRDCLIEENRFDGCNGGIRICGTGHVVRNNVIVNSRGTGIRLFYGMTADQGGHYQAASRCEISNNTIVNAQLAGILVGDAGGRDWKEKGVQNVPPFENRIVGNTIIGNSGDLLVVRDAPGNFIDGNRFDTRGSAVVSSPGENAVFEFVEFKQGVRIEL